MSDKFTEDNLKNMGYVWNGKEWARPNKQGVDKVQLPKSLIERMNPLQEEYESLQYQILSKIGASAEPGFSVIQNAKAPLPKDFVKTVRVLTKVSLCLFGTPMPKQSVRATKSGAFYQPKEMKQRTEDYRKQIMQQLTGKNVFDQFCIFEKEVHITKMHFVYPPLKAFHKKKGMMDRIRAGEIIYKNTRPDVIDNLKKLVCDAMSGLVYKDDGIIVSEDNVKKYYGTGGCIIIEMEGC